MKIKQIMLKNFANVNEIEINLSGSVVYLIGENGSGKTTVGLNSVWFVLEGLALKGKKVLHGERFRFIGNHAKSAIGQLILHDETENIDITISRKLLKNKTELKITASDGRQMPDNFIDDIFNLFSINPVGFAKLTPQEQATELGIDTWEYDQKKKIAYDERTELGRDVKRLKGVVDEIGDIEKVEPVDFKELVKARDMVREINDREQEILQLKEEIKEKQQLVDIYEMERNELLKVKKGWLSLSDDETSFDEQIESSESTNQQAAKYQEMLKAQANLDKAKTLYDSKQVHMDKIETDRIEHIKSCNLPFSGITINDSGGMLLNDRPFSETYFSKGEILRVGIRLAAASNPKLKYVFIPDSQSIDKENREQLFDELVESGFQVVAEYVDTEKQKDHGSILLKESEVVESYDNDNDLEEL